jgi:uncharacterized protein
MMHISQLFLFPVKSLRGFSVNAARLTPQGLEHDRFWMIINDNNQFVTQRKLSQMVLIRTAIHKDQLILSSPQQTSPLIIPINQTPSSAAFAASVWKDTCQVLDEGEKASMWLSTALNSASPLRLVRMASQPRPQSKPDLLGAHTHTHFADAAPFLIANEASLNAVNQQLIAANHLPVPMENFRPNIVVSGLEAFAEHQLNGLQHNYYHFKHCYPCQRCVIPTIHIETGIRHAQQQPFSLIADINAMPNNNKAPAFGENAILMAGVGNAIQVGDILQATKTTTKDLIQLSPTRSGYHHPQC